MSRPHSVFMVALLLEYSHLATCLVFGLFFLKTRVVLDLKETTELAEKELKSNMTETPPSLSK